MHSAAAAAAAAPQGASLIFSASTAYCLPLFAMVLSSQVLLAGDYARLSIPTASDSIDTGSSADAAASATPGNNQHHAFGLDLCSPLHHVYHTASSELDP